MKFTNCGKGGGLFHRHRKILFKLYNIGALASRYSRKNYESFRQKKHRRSNPPHTHWSRYFIDFNLAGTGIIVNQLVKLAGFDYNEKQTNPEGAKARDECRRQMGLVYPFEKR